MANAEATAISQLDAGQKAMYSDLLHDWRFERAEHANMKRKEGKLLMEISRTITTRHLYMISGKDEIYDRLITVKQQLTPTTATRSRELEADLPETTGYQAQDDFLTVVRTIAPK
ncbi:hypothetical protein TW65_07937 [Stemphylium lycopersici]|uniref:Uncharacterized protein n=1 Tax=Stemphylium lycopersici TaxID=183478 RepID=A0A364MVX6_STELY|nr:hypothetical protein TW65_07937 [Stemphylium lycopersici]RAR05069.1 hypothetical protein DDE83_007562 [Stemphylium lycopersici]